MAKTVRNMRRAAPSPRLLAAGESYLLALDAENKAPKTITTYRTALKALAGALADPAINEVTAEQVRRLLVQMRDDGRAAATRRTYAVIWRAYFGWLVDEGLLGETPMERVGMPQLPSIEPPGFTDDELRRLLATCDAATEMGARDRAILLTLVATGLRLAEVLQLQRADVVVDAVAVPMLRIIGKGSKERRIALQRPARDAIHRYLLLRGEDDKPALWLSEKGTLTDSGLYQMVAKRGRLAGIEGVHPHRFRRAALGMMSDAGLPEADVQRIAGHKTAAMTRHYTAWSAADRSNAALVEASPLNSAALGQRRPASAGSRASPFAIVEL